VITAKVTKECGAAAPVAQGANLEMTIYQGAWHPSNYAGVSAASITVTKNGQNYTGTTGSNGKYTFASIPKGMVNIKVEKQGYQTVTQSYNMPTYTAKKNIQLATS
jgi:hypothetical protein